MFLLTRSCKAIGFLESLLIFYYLDLHFCRSLFPCGEDMVAIIDDREDVWNYSSNVIAVLPYKFFKGCSRVHIVLVDHL